MGCFYFSEIWERQEAVQELMNDCHGNAKHLKTVLFRLPDLDQKLTAANHKKVRKNFLNQFRAKVCS